MPFSFFTQSFSGNSRLRIRRYRITAVSSALVSSAKYHLSGGYIMQPSIMQRIAGMYYSSSLG